MEDNFVSYESMLAAQDSAKWAFWGMVATWGSLVVSALTLILAYRALTSWKEQEKLKVKQDFKASLFQLRSLLLHMPDCIEAHKLRQGLQFIRNPSVSFQIGIGAQEFNQIKTYATDFERVEKGMESCLACWMATENILSDPKLKKLWASISSDYEKYAQGKGEKTELINKIDALLGQPFVF